MSLKIGYIIPEFPGQTHIWMWREIAWVRRWTAALHIYSTRQPPDRDRARHAFAETARGFTTYLWPIDWKSAVAWAAHHHFRGLLRCIHLAMTLPGEKGRLHAAKLIPSACFLARDAEERGLTHLHCHSCANSAILAMMVKRLIGVPFSMTLNANIDWWGGAMAEKFADAAFTIAITQWLLEQIRRDYPQLGQDQALLGRIGVDTTNWTAAGRAAALARDSFPFRLVTVGRLHASKGHDLLLGAVAKLVKDRHRHVTLRLIGDGPQRAELERLAAELNLRDRVTFTGSLAEHEIQQQLRSADAFVLASHAEPLGVVYMEAMAAGVPTIGTDAGGVPEIITTGEDGLLVGPRNVDALVEAVERLMDDPALAERLGRRGREKIVRAFDSRLGAATLYKRITGQDPPATEADRARPRPAASDDDAPAWDDPKTHPAEAHVSTDLPGKAAVG